MSEYLGKEAVRAHEARIEALSKLFEDVELQGKEMSAAMQEFDSRIFAHRFYHEAPNDVFELIFSHFSDVDEKGWGRGGLNFLRLVNKRCMQVVESVATRLTSKRSAHYNYLPSVVLKSCRGIEHIRCFSLRSLEGCPDGLKSLYIENGGSVLSLDSLSPCKGLEMVEIHRAEWIMRYDLSPLSSCTRLKTLKLDSSQVADLSPLSSTLLLEELVLWNDHGEIKDISTLSKCKRLKILDISGNQGIKDLSPLCQCPDLEDLNISRLPLIKDLSFLEKGFTKLRVLDICSLPVHDLSPLIKLQSLEDLNCYGIPTTTSLLPLARCYKLKKVTQCPKEAAGLEELKMKRPDIDLTF